MAILLGFKPYVLNAYAALAGEKPGYTALNEHLQFIGTQGVGVSGYKAALEGYFASTSNAVLATSLLTNLGLSASFTQAQAEGFLVANTGNRVGAIMDLAQALYSYAGTDAALLAAKTAYAGKIDSSNVFSSNYGNLNGEALDAAAVGQTISLTTSADSAIGTALDDIFLARTNSGSNTLQSGDKIDGGAGVDTVYVDFGSVGNAITPVFKNIETVVVRAQSAGNDSNGITSVGDGNNLPNTQTVQFDAQRSLAVNAADQVTAATGVTRWESNNSRSDVLIEDVRIGTAQKTKDITIAFVESDPGNVDMGVYFDQHSLRNSSSGNTTVTIKLMDTGAAAATATAATPLLNNPYDQFKIGINGVLTAIQLDKVAVAQADTYAALLVEFNKALTGTGVTAALGATFSVVDPLSGLTVTGTSIVLTGAAGAAITEMTGSGWYNTTGASVPANSNIYTVYSTAAASVSELVTSTIVLDDVGRGSTGGDLVVGGMSTGLTSTSRGVERFEITVQDSSKLQTINSTNNALREVTIVNGATSNTSSAYNTVVANAGDLTVNGKVTNADTVLPGVDNGSNFTHDARGFTDVRVIDGSAMTGKLAFTAAVTTDSLSKYVNLVDTAASPTADVAGAGNTNFNVKGANFLYTGGANNDTFNVTVDSAVAASTTLTGQSDFTMVIDGGAGNDKITTSFGGNQTANWNVDQKANANMTINGGTGDDTITTTGAGAVVINAGAGNDVVFTDNSGTVGAAWVINAGTTPVPSDLATAGGAGGFLYKGVVTVTFTSAGSTAGVTAGAAVAKTNGFEATANIPTGANYAETQFYINQAIKDAVNNNAVLKNVLLAEDGPSNTLTIKSLVDGTFNPNDLKVTVSSDYVAGTTASEDATVLTAYKAYAGNTAATQAQATAAIATAVTNANGITGMDTTPVLGSQNSGISVAVATTLQGVTAVTETATFTAVPLAAGATVIVNGATITAGVAGATAAEVVAALMAGVTVGGATYAGPNNAAAYTVAAGAANTLVYTSAVAGNVVDLTSTGTAPFAAPVVVQGVTGVAEQFTATFSGTSFLGETITFDGVASAAPLADATATTAAAAVQAAAGAVGGAWTGALPLGGNIITFTANAAGALTDVTSASFVDSGSFFNGTNSGAKSDNTINLGAGNDVLVLSTGATSLETIVVSGYDLGTNTIINFSTTAGQTDKLNLNAYLVDAGTSAAHTYTVGATVAPNSVTVLSTPVFTTTDTFAGLTAAKFLAAINTAGHADYAGIVSATLDSTNNLTAAQLVGGVGHAVVMVENSGNKGEYAAFELTFKGDAAATVTDFTAATLIGTFDFGTTLPALVVGTTLA